MIGTYTSRARGESGHHCDIYAQYFGTPMIGTFNCIVDFAISKFKPTIYDPATGRRFWEVKLNGHCQAFAYRWDGSALPENHLELISETLLPGALKAIPFEIEVIEPEDEPGIVLRESVGQTELDAVQRSKRNRQHREEVSEDE